METRRRPPSSSRPGGRRPRPRPSDTAAIAGTDRVAYICAPSLQQHCSSTNASYSPQQDPSFPNRFTQLTQWSSYRLTALRDAANQQADAAEAQSVHYAAILTMLAVAVFLFGYSLTPQGRSRRRLFSTVAGSFVLVAGVWALFQALSPVQKPPDAAATAFANGEVQLQSGDPEPAIVSFTRAIKLRPEFVDAYADRAQAEFAAGIPRIGSGTDALPTTAGPVTVPSREALDKAVEDNLKAREAGSESATVLADLGRDLFYRGIVNGSPADLRSSHADLEEAAAKYRTQDHAALLLAAAELRMAEDNLALARVEAAEHEYAQAEKTLSERTASAEPIIAAALTDLSLIETVRPGPLGAHRGGQPATRRGRRVRPSDADRRQGRGRSSRGDVEGDIRPAGPRPRALHDLQARRVRPREGRRLGAVGVQGSAARRVGGAPGAVRTRAAGRDGR